MKNTHNSKLLLVIIILGFLIVIILLLQFSHSYWQVLLGVVAIPLFFAIIKNPFWGLCLMISLLPFEEAAFLGTAWNIPKLIGILTFVAYLLDLLINKRKISWTKEFLILFAFILYMSASILWSVYQGSFQLQAIQNLLMMGAFFFLIPQLINSDKKLTIIFKTYLFSALLAASLGLYNVFTHPYIYRVSIVIPGETPWAGRSLAYYPYLIGMGIIYVVSQLYMASYKKGRNIFLLGILSLLVIAALASGTRSFFIVLPFAWLAMLMLRFLFNRKYRLTPFVYLFLLVGSLALGYNLLPERTKERFQLVKIVEGVQGAQEGRINYWQMGFIEFLEHPILGVGLRNSYLLSSSIYFLALHKYGVMIGGSLLPWQPVEPHLPSEIRAIHNIYLVVYSFYSFSSEVWGA
jgi:O-antigen ligase